MNRSQLNGREGENVGRGRACAKTQKQDVAWMFEELKDIQYAWSEES